MKKKLTALLLAAAAVFTVIPGAYADTEIQPQADQSGAVEILLHIDPEAIPLSENAQFVLTGGDGEEYRGEAWISGETAEIIPLQFQVEPYSMGKTFTFSMTGLSYIEYYGTNYAENRPVILETGDWNSGSFNLTAKPKHIKAASVAIDGAAITDFSMPPRVLNGVTMVPVIELAKHLGIPTAQYHEDYNSVEIALGDRQLLLNLDTNYATLDGEAMELPVEPQFIGWTVFAPIRTLTDAFGSQLTVNDLGSYLDIQLTPSAMVAEYSRGKANVVNSRGISSETDYLIWVSKSEYKLRVYTGKKGSWKFEKEFTVGIGAPGTPTCEGQYRYYSKESRWTYNNYYVGPIMRFNGGYAIHSTLQRYNGTPYDDRVGMKLSHGCVRVQKENMNWLVSYVPLYTKIYITG